MKTIPIILNMATTAKLKKVFPFAFVFKSLLQSPVKLFTCLWATRIFTTISRTKFNSNPTMNTIVFNIILPFGVKLSLITLTRAVKSLVSLNSVLRNIKKFTTSVAINTFTSFFGFAYFSFMFFAKWFQLFTNHIRPITIFRTKVSFISVVLVSINCKVFTTLKTRHNVPWAPFSFYRSDNFSFRHIQFKNLASKAITALYPRGIKIISDFSCCNQLTTL